MMEAAQVVLAAIPAVQSATGPVAKIKDAKDERIDLEIDISTARNLIWKADSRLIEGQTVVDLKKQIDELNRRCYRGEDLIEDIALNPVLPYVMALSVGNRRKGLKRKSDHVTNLMELQQNGDNTQPRGDSNCSVLPMVGRNTDLDAIIRMLSSSSSPVGVTIVGARLLGKTMLAGNVVKDLRVTSNFRILRASVAANGSFDSSVMVKKLENKLLNGLSGGNLDKQQQSLLIWFDDCVKVDNCSWHSFRSHIESKKFVVKFLITSPSPKVPQTTGTSAYYLTPLSDEECQTVIEDRALWSKRDLPVEFLRLNAVELAKKCAGYPGIAAILGVALGTCGVRDWQIDVLTKELWDISQIRAEIVSSLKSIYSNMEPRFRQCLAYLSLFPCTHHLGTDELIQLWIGEGFITEDEGKAYIDELLDRSILQHLCDHETDKTKPMSYKLHAFNHIFFHLTALRAFLVLKGSPSALSFDDSVRHLSLICENSDPKIMAKLQEMTGLRTFLALHDQTKGQIPPNLFKSLSHSLPKLNRLRVLTLKETNVAELPNSIHKLKRLRYLDVSYSLIERLPDKLSEIGTLQFLKIKDTVNLNILPPNFKDLTNLMCIDWEVSDIDRFELPLKIGNLRKLQTLPWFKVENQEGHLISELKNMNNLEGSIRISHLENVRSKEDAEAANLCNKNRLERIELEWSKQVTRAPSMVVLAGLEPHQFLKELKITNAAFPEWICDPKRMLEIIHLKNCRSPDILPPFGVLQNLKSLTIEGASELQRIDINFSRISSASIAHFPCLDKLVLKDLRVFLEWTGLGPTDMPKLRELNIMNCPKLESLPALDNLTKLEELEIENCPELQYLPGLPTSLKSLLIMDSKLLKIGYEARGDDWQKVFDISKIYIDDEMICSPAAPISAVQNCALFQGYQTTTNKAGATTSRLVLTKSSSSCN